MLVLDGVAKFILLPLGWINVGALTKDQFAFADKIDEVAGYLDFLMRDNLALLLWVAVIPLIFLLTQKNNPTRLKCFAWLLLGVVFVSAVVSTVWLKMVCEGHSFSVKTVESAIWDYQCFLTLLGLASIAVHLGWLRLKSAQ